MELIDLIAIGIGGMVGGGIFAVLGLSLKISGKYAVIAFIFSGLIALLTAINYAYFSTKIKSKGGTVSYLIYAFGDNLFSRTLNILLLFAYIVMIAIYAYAFGSYLTALLINSENALFRKIFSTVIILIFTFINYFSSKLTTKTENKIVALKILILSLFILFGLFVKSSTNLPSKNIFTSLLGGLLIFIAYEGFELISNAVYNVKSKRKIFIAYIFSVFFVTILYSLIAYISIKTLTIEEIEKYSDFALAKAVEPFLGKFGFISIGIAALLSTASAINATIFGSAKISYTLAKLRELPKDFEKRLWNKIEEGLIFIALISILLADFVNLRGISSLASLIFLFIFSMINLGAFIKRKELKINSLIPVFAFILSFSSFVYLFMNTISNKKVISILFFAIFISIFLEIYLKNKNKSINSIIFD